MAGALGLSMSRLLGRQRGAGSVPAVPSAQAPRGRAWLHAGDAAGADAAVALAHRLVARRPGLGLLITHAEAVAVPPPGRVPPRVVLHGPPPTGAGGLRRMLQDWSPACLMQLGGRLDPVLLAGCAQRDVALLLADMTEAAVGRGWALWPGLAGRLLRPCRAILVRDEAALRAFRRNGAPLAACRLTGRLSTAHQPLTCTEAEREAIAAAVAGRPVWLAAGVPAREVGAVLTAHLQVRRLLHRLLLYIVPAEPGDGAAVAQKAQLVGLKGGCRSAEHEIAEDDHLYIADTDDEYGLWYRLAPVCYMGGSLMAGGPGSLRNPMEAAALGAAIIHGPLVGAWRDTYAALAAGSALRPVANARQLTEALIELMAPDRAATLAHNGWRVVSEGAEATEAAADAILRAMDEAAAASDRAG